MVRLARLPCAALAVLAVLLVPGGAEDAELTASATTYGDRLRATTRLPPGVYSSRLHNKPVEHELSLEEDEHEDNGLHKAQRVSSSPRPKVDRTALFRRQRPTTSTAAPVDEADSEEAVLQDARDLCRHSPNSYFCQPSAGRKRPQRVRGPASAPAASTSTSTTTTTTTTTEVPTTRRALPITMARRSRPKPAKQPTIIYTNLYLPGDVSEAATGPAVFEQAADQMTEVAEAVVDVPVKNRKRVSANREPASKRPYTGLSDTTSAPQLDEAAVGEDSTLFVDDAATTTMRPAFTASRRPPAIPTRPRDICDDPAHMFLCEPSRQSGKRPAARRPVGSGLRTGGISRVAVSDEFLEHAQPLPTISSRSGPQHEAETFVELTGADYAPAVEAEERPAFDVDPASEGFYFSRPALPVRPRTPEPSRPDAPFLFNLGPSKLPAFSKPSEDAFPKPARRAPAPLPDRDQSASANEQTFKYQPVAVFPGAAPAYPHPLPHHEAVPQPLAPQPLHHQVVPQQAAPQPVMAFALQPVEALLAAERQREEEHNNLAAHAILTALRMQADALREQSATPVADLVEATPAPRKQSKKNKKKNKRPKKPEHEVTELVDEEDVLVESVRPTHGHGHSHGHGHRRPVEVLSEPPRGALIVMDGLGPHGPPRPVMYRGHMRPRPGLALHRFKRQDDGYIYPKPTPGDQPVPGEPAADDEGYDYPPPGQPFPAPGPSSPAPNPSSPAPGPSSPAPEPSSPAPGPSPTPDAPEPEAPVPTSSVPVRPKPTPAPELKPTEGPAGPGAQPQQPGRDDEEGYDYPPPGQPFPAPGPNAEGGVELPGAPEGPEAGPASPSAEEPAPTPAPAPGPGPSSTPAPAPDAPSSDGSDQEEEGYSYPRPERGLGSGRKV